MNISSSEPLSRNLTPLHKTGFRLMSWFSVFILLITSTGLFAQFDVVEFETEAQQELYQELIKELRCLVCQNQNLSDSNADLAKDLRRKVYEMISAGKQKKDITNYMVQRYGQFVLYKPQLNSSTYLLWLAPFFLLGGLVIAALYRVKKPRKNNAVNYSEEQIKHVKSLMEEKH